MFWYTNIHNYVLKSINYNVLPAFVRSWVWNLQPQRIFEISGSVSMPQNSLFVPLWNSRGKQLILFHIPDFSAQGVIFGHEPYLLCHCSYIAPSSLSLNFYYICCTAAFRSGPDPDAAPDVGELKSEKMIMMRLNTVKVSLLLLYHY